MVTPFMQIRAGANAGGTASTASSLLLLGAEPSVEVANGPSEPVRWRRLRHCADSVCRIDAHRQFGAPVPAALAPSGRQFDAAPGAFTAQPQNRRRLYVGPCFSPFGGGAAVRSNGLGFAGRPGAGATASASAESGRD